MEEVFQSFYANGALLIMWGALILHLLVPIPHSAHPITLWRKLAEQLANKVNNNHNYSQSVISGSLALGLMLFPCLILLIAVKPFVWQIPLYELVLLILALDWRNSETLTKQLVTSISSEDKAQCRALLQPYLNRDTGNL
ncbi:adenosylcobinamide-phosphate synthase, partial [Vibrio parahaemolyticus]|nr:adenosylcobinamide-phosphate synthase [Vibrio parahaemolyticus]